MIVFDQKLGVEVVKISKRSNSVTGNGSIACEFNLDSQMHATKAMIETSDELSKKTD